MGWHQSEEDRNGLASEGRWANQDWVCRSGDPNSGTGGFLHQSSATCQLTVSDVFVTGVVWTSFLSINETVLMIEASVSDYHED